MSVIDNVFGFFVEEAGEHLRILEQGLLELEKNPSAADTWLDPLFRAAHTLKGSANLVKVNDVGAVAHRLEDLLEAIRDGERELSRLLVNAMLFALDHIREIIHVRQAGEEVPAELVSDALSRMAQAEYPELASADSDSTDASDTTDEDQAAQREPTSDGGYSGIDRRQPGRRAEDAGAIRVGLGKIEALMGLVGEFTVTKNHLLNRLPEMVKMKAEVDFAGQRLLKEVTGFAERYDYTLPARNSQSDDETFNELEFDRYDELNLFSRKLREITNDIDEALQELAGFFNGFSGDVQSLDRMTEEMKEQISAARTVQASQLFQRFNRTIRDLSHDLNKPIDLFISGGETPIDRIIYDGLFDPLLHIVQNSFAHGIESAQEREAKGKPATAKIWMKAERRGNTVEISVEDDGCGINLERVRRRGIEKGFITETEDLSEQDLIQLIFRPGFSTSQSADKVSGRGVGMDVVLDRLSSLNGTIDVWTETGRGTRFRMRLPLSLVVVNVIQFTCCGRKMVIPSALVDEIVDLQYEMRKPDQSKDRERTQQVDLAGLLNLARQDEAPGYGIVSQSGGASVMMLVDEILGQEDTVIKPFGSFLEEVPFFSGTSLAGDGTMRLVINPARMRHQTTDIPVGKPLAMPKAKESTMPKVLVVDDSLSVRKYATMLLTGRGYQVVTATNGQEALDKLLEENIFSIITDLEMPIMHGYELLRELKRNGTKIPVAVLTSRAGDQHRKEALDLGATDYLLKPFDEDGLLNVVRKHKQM